MKYHAEAFDRDGKRIGGFAVFGATMAEALAAASKNIEIAIRPEQHEMRISRLYAGAQEPG